MQNKYPDHLKIGHNAEMQDQIQTNAARIGLILVRYQPPMA